ncbi:hypothetical protein TM1040_2256 [Ruegeria sp. TM1040]|nr:hypothetical protein TM1040_2256 [Ruegeria sp. TM1040]
MRDAGAIAAMRRLWGRLCLQHDRSPTSAKNCGRGVDHILTTFIFNLTIKQSAAARVRAAPLRKRQQETIMIVAALILGVIGGSVSAVSAGVFFGASLLLCSAVYVGSGLLVSVMTLFVGVILQSRRQSDTPSEERAVAHA